jgi:hypothetical protein
MKRLTKDNFWNEVRDMYPEAVNHFCKWIDRYKEEVGWRDLFAEGIKFHDIPFDMQNGIIARFDLECFNGKKGADAVRDNEPARMRDLFRDLQQAIDKRQIKLN